LVLRVTELQDSYKVKKTTVLSMLYSARTIEWEYFK